MPYVVARVDQLEVVLADGLPYGFKGFAVNSPALRGGPAAADASTLNYRPHS